MKATVETTEKYYVERSGGSYEGRFWSYDEQRYYRKVFICLAEAFNYGRKLGFEPLLVD